MPAPACLLTLISYAAGVKKKLTVYAGTYMVILLYTTISDDNIDDVDDSGSGVNDETAGGQVVSHHCHHCSSSYLGNVLDPVNNLNVIIFNA